jgi:hypothetical protein
MDDLAKLVVPTVIILAAVAGGAVGLYAVSLVLGRVYRALGLIPAEIAPERDRQHCPTRSAAERMRRLTGQPDRGPDGPG